jgi:hypothetical protein
MPDEYVMTFLLFAILIGVGATIVMDLWVIFRTRVLGVPPASYGMLGRWIGHFPKGRFVHDNIAKASPVPGELAIGWAAHYAIGIVFAALLLSIFGLDWARQPTPLPALAVGLVTVAAPLLVMQPGMGMGIAASKAPNPNAIRLRALVTHAVFGIGLYVSALIVAPLIRG